MACRVPSGEVIMKKIAFIPARSGSKRVVDKNIRTLGRHPLLAYAVSAAVKSGCFDSVVCATDSEAYAEIAVKYGAEVPVLRPAQISSETSPDIEWVTFMLKEVQSKDQFYDIFAILRPTSPFRAASTIKRAMDEFLANEKADSIRAVQMVSEHPGKMWVCRDNSLLPLFPMSEAGVPWHSCQYQSLPPVLVQNASLEIARTERVFATGSISGSVVAPFFTLGFEGFDINTEEDWRLAEIYLESEMELSNMCEEISTID